MQKPQAQGGLHFLAFHAPPCADFLRFFISDQFWRTAGAFSKDDHLFQTSSWRVPCVLHASTAPAPPRPAPRPHHTQNQPFKITLFGLLGHSSPAPSITFYFDLLCRNVPYFYDTCWLGWQLLSNYSVITVITVFWT